ncbi:MAG: ABC transporter ATP-binding protein, partial [Bacillota bacterium]|nr:ABC transporter ATP-binding protein [Bacillota bacterium]
MAFIELNHVSFTYPDASEPALKDVSLKVEKGEFVTLFGASGSGKSTLLRLLKKEIQPHGELTGKITINGLHQNENDGNEEQIGFVFQDPENQVVADRVLHELAFGLENLALPVGEMRSRIAEMVHYFGAEALLNRRTEELSGGKKQQMNLASVLLMQPDLLLLDEPTSQLDPVSSRELLDMLVRLNEEFGMTIIIAEHRLEEVSALSDKMVLMDHGSVAMDADAKSVMRQIWNSPKRLYVPSIPSLYLNSMNQDGECTRDIPLTVKEGKKWFNQICIQQNKEESRVNHRSGKVLLQAEHLFLKYGKKSDWVIENLNFSLEKGDIYALLGGNGSGKSTLFKAICGIVTPESGRMYYKENRVKGSKNK